jgi:hypothetical protein
MKNTNLFCVTTIFFLFAISVNPLLSQYLVKNNIDEKVITGKIFKANNVKKVTEVRDGELFEIKIIDRNGYIAESIIYPPSTGYKNDAAPDTINNFHQKIFYYKDSDGRDTLVVTYNNINMLVTSDRISYHEGYRQDILIGNYGKFFAEKTIKTGLNGEVLETKMAVIPSEQFKKELTKTDSINISKFNSEEGKKLDPKTRFEFNSAGDELYVIKTDYEGKEKKTKHCIFNPYKSIESEYKVDDSGKEEINTITEFNGNGQPVKKTYFCLEKICMYDLYTYMPNGLISSKRNFMTRNGDEEYEYTISEYDNAGKLIKIRNYIPLDKKEEIWEYVYEYYE